MSAASGTLMQPALTLRVFSRLDGLQEILGAWHELLADFPSATTFSTPEWLISWWEAFGKSRQLLVLASFDSDSRLIGLAPLSISRERFGGAHWLRVLRLMGDGSGDSDNLDLPVRPGFEKLFGESVLRFLNQERRAWDVCQLNTLPLDSPIGRVIRQSSKPQGLLLFEYERKRSSIELPNSWHDYEQRLSSEDRKNLERYTRRLHKRYSVRIYRCMREEELPAGLEALFRLHQLRWMSAGEPGSFGSLERREFYAALSNRLLKRGWLELWNMELNGVIAAVQFAFRFGSRVFQLQEGNDPERSSDRVGFILRGEVLKQLISEGATEYDFLGGSDPYKTRWGASVGHYVDLHFAPRYSRGGVWLRALNSAGRAKTWLRSWLPRDTWKLLNKINVSRKALHHRLAPPLTDSTTGSKV